MAAVNRPLILVANPGGASRKYAIYENRKCVAMIHYEHEEGAIVVSGQLGGEALKSQPVNISHLTFAPGHLVKLLDDSGVLAFGNHVLAIALRVVAPDKFFQEDRVLDDGALKRLSQLEDDALLHISASLQEITQLKKIFSSAKVIGISDSAFHAQKPGVTKIYGLSSELQKEAGIERYGYHGVAAESVVSQLKEAGKLPQRLVICHLGSGSSVTAVKDSVAIDNTMGFSPLEGVMMATRSGNMDIAAAFKLKKHLGLKSRNFLEYLNTKAGLLGVSGYSSSVSELLKVEEKDELAKLALDMYTYRIRQAIGASAAALSGLDALVFTATIGERSSQVRKRVSHGLLHLGLELDPHLNHHIIQPDEIAQISPPHHPVKVYIVPANEDALMAKRALNFI